MTDNMRELLEEADKRLSEWHIDDAARLYEEAVSREPGRRSVVNTLARCYAMRGQVKRLINICLKWQEYLVDTDQLEMAGVVAESILKFDPASVPGRVCLLRHVRTTCGEDEYFNALNETVSYFVEIGEGELALKVLKKAQEEYPNNVDIAVKLADVHMAEGDIAEATNGYRDIIGKLESSGNSLRAADVYRRLEMLLPNDMDIIMRLAQIYLDNEKYAEASQEFRNALRVEYSNHEALCGLGNSLIKMDDVNGAILAYRKALISDPMDVETREALARAYVSMGNIEDAVKDLLAVGTNLTSCQDYSEAERIYQLILEICPNQPVAVRELSNIKDAVARQKAREEQIRKLQSGELRKTAPSAPVAAKTAPAEQPKEAPKPVSHEAPSASSEDDLYGGDNPYAGGTDLYDDAPLAGGDYELGAPDGSEGAQLGGAVAATSAPASVVNELGYTRVLASTEQDGLYKPVPFLMVKFPELIPLVQRLIDEAPERSVFGWQTLPELDAENMVAAEAKKAEEVQPEAVLPPPVEGGGAVRSAFGDSGGSMFDGSFSASISGGGHRRSRWDMGGAFGDGGGFGGFGGRGRYRRSSSDDENDLRQKLMEKMKQQEETN